MEVGGQRRWSVLATAQGVTRAVRQSVTSLPSVTYSRPSIARLSVARLSGARLSITSPRPGGARPSHLSEASTTRPTPSVARLTERDEEDEALPLAQRLAFRRMHELEVS